MTKEDEKLIADAIVKIAKHAETMHPTKAAIKVAREKNLTPGRIKIVCAAFNQGQQLAQLQVGENTEEKLAELPLIDADEVVRVASCQQPYDENHDNSEKDDKNKKTAAVFTAKSNSYYDPEWDSPAAVSFYRQKQLEKTAESANPVFFNASREVALLRQEKQHKELVKKLTEQQKIAEDAWHQANSAFARIISYFRKSAYNREPKNQVIKAAYALWGAPAVSLIEKACKFAGVNPEQENVKIAQDVPADIRKEPYSSLAQLFALRQTFCDAVATHHKYADLRNSLPVISSFISNKSPEDVEYSIESELEKLEDYDHEDKIRAIKAKTLLAGLMTDPSSPISKYDPRDVIAAYNEFAELSPRGSIQPLVLRSWLERRLAGRLEPFEVQTAVQLEKELNAAGIGGKRHGITYS